MSKSQDSLARPGLRERRLSRVHFDGDETPRMGAMPMDTPLPLNIRQSAPQREVESANQEYFDAPAVPSSVSNEGDENSRGRSTRDSPSPTRTQALPAQQQIAAYAGLGLQAPQAPAHLDDISPRSTGFDHPRQLQPSYNHPPSNPPQPMQQQPFPRGLPPAHVRGSPQLPSEPYRASPTIYHTPRMGDNQWFDPTQERRASAPTVGYEPRNRAATYSKGGRFSVDSGRSAAHEAYSNTPPRNYPPQPYEQQHIPHYQQPQMYLTHSGSETTLAGDMPPDMKTSPEYAAYAMPQHLPPYQPDQQVRTLKPALRRTQTEEEARRTTRDAVDIVHAHTQGLRQRKNGSADDAVPDVLNNRHAGVLSNLLQLYGTSTAPRRSNSTESKWDGESTALSRATSAESHVQPRGRLNRMESSASIATTLYEEDLAPEDPRIRSKEAFDDEKQKPALPGSRDRRYSYGDGGDAASVRSKRSFKDIIRRRRSFAQDEDAVYSDMTGKGGMMPVNSKTRKRRLSITKHVADILQRHNFILKLAKALMMFGSPSHRLESQLAATAQVLEVDAQFIHFPSVVIASFGDPDTHTSETHFVKAAGGLDLGKLQEVHHVYRQVVHDEIGVQEGGAALSRILKAPPIYSTWQRMLIAACAAGVIGPLGFGGSFVDGWVAASFGALLAFLQLYVVRKSAMYSNIFEISVATLTSFIARGLSTTQYFCYPALASSGVVLILPGYAILCGSLELASKNLVAGSVRMVYAIIYSLFLGFGIAVGSDFYFLLDPNSRKGENSLDGASTYSMDGTFTANNGTSPFSLTGSFTFTNATTDTANSELFKGNVACPRDPNWEWWRQGINPYTLFALVPIFSLLLCLANLTPIKSKQLPVMVIISCVGYVTNMVANKYIFNHSDIVSFLGSFVIGILGNLYSRIFKGTGFVVMVPGVLFLVPSGIAAAGGLAMTETGSNGDSYSNGLIIGFRMVQVAIGITVGLFFSSFIVYSFGRRKQAALFAF